MGTELEVRGGLEGRPVVQALGVPLQPVRLVQQECEAEAERARRGQEPGALPTGTTPKSRSPRHSGLAGAPLSLLFAQAGFPALG